MNLKYKILMHLIIFALLPALCLRCSVHEDVSDVNRTSKQVKKTAENMSQTVDKIKDRTEDIYFSTREVVSLYNQKVSFKDILEAEGVSDKLLQASVFFASMEFQHWRNGKRPGEQLDSREDLMTNSVRYFFWKIADFIGDNPSIEVPYLPSQWPFVGKPQSDWINLSALAVAMGHVHENQLRVTKKWGTKIYSMYDIVKESLLLKPLYEAGESVPPYVIEVLRHEESAKYLLQLRHNFYALIVASRLSNFEESFWTQIRHLFWGWEVNPSEFNRAQYEMFNEILERGLETKLFLNQIQESVLTAKVVERLYKNLVWVITDNAPFESLIKQMGMMPSQNQVEKFQIQLDYQPDVKTEAEKLVVNLNSYTGSTLFVFNRDAYEKSKEENKSSEVKPWWKFW